MGTMLNNGKILFLFRCGSTVGYREIGSFSITRLNQDQDEETEKKGGIAESGLKEKHKVENR
jgi:hypothetical protein